MSQLSLFTRQLPPKIREFDRKCVSLGNSKERRYSNRRKNKSDRNDWSRKGLRGRQRKRERGLRESTKRDFRKKNAKDRKRNVKDRKRNVKRNVKGRNKND